LVISNCNGFRVLFDKIASVCFLWKIYLYFSIGNDQPSEPALCQLYQHTFVSYSTYIFDIYIRSWRRGVVVSGVRQWTKLTHVGTGYNWDGWPSSGGYTISVCNQPTRSTRPCIPPGSLNRVPASAGVKAGISPLPGDPIWHVSSRSGEASCELLYSVYLYLYPIRTGRVAAVGVPVAMGERASDRTISAKCKLCNIIIK